MRIPLIVKASPKILKAGPNIFMSKGDWYIESDHKDSELQITLDGSPPENYPCHTSMLLRLAFDSVVCVNLTKQGTESELSVSATKMVH